MLTLLLGPDTFTKRLFISSLAQKLGAELVVFRADDALPDASIFSQTDLFSKIKIFWFDGFMPDFPAGLSGAIASQNCVVISVVSLDKRKKENKELLAKKNVEVRDFLLPHGQELDKWIQSRVKELGGTIGSPQASFLAQVLGRDNGKEVKAGGKVISVEEIFNLWQVDSEIKKLLAFTDNREINERDITALVPENREVNVFEITNAIADGKKTQALNLLHDFLKTQGGAEEKGAVIQLNALLAEQFRNVAMVADFRAQNKSESEILELTGWKSGRLFVIKKIAAKFPLKKVLDFLNKLQALDQELKFSAVPPKVLLDLIISQLLA